MSVFGCTFLRYTARNRITGITAPARGNGADARAGPNEQSRRGERRTRRRAAARRLT